MATEFICEVGRNGPPSRDYAFLSDWNDACACDLTVATTKVYSSIKYSGTGYDVRDGWSVDLYRGGVRMDCDAELLHATDTQTLVEDISGTDVPQAGDQWRHRSSDAYGWVTLQDSGDSVIACAECYKDAEMLDRIEFEDWITNSVNRVKIYTPASERHSGVAGTGFILFSYDNRRLIHLDDLDVLVQGIEFRGGGNQIDCNYRNGSHVIEIEGCIFHDNIRGPLIDPSIRSNATLKMWNCVLYNSKSTGVDSRHETSIIYIENCSIYNCNGTGVLRAQCYNVVVHRGSGDEFACFGDECTGDYNCDGLEVGSDGSAPGSHSLHDKSLQDIAWRSTFLEPLDESYELVQEVDLHIYSDSDLVGSGTDRSTGVIGFNTDIDGQTREVPWTIGVDQIPSSSSSSMSASSSSSSSHSSSSSVFYLELRDYVY